MDIRVVNDNIFDINVDCIIYFVDNSFTDKNSQELISNSGDRMLEVLSKISSIVNYDFKIIPVFDIKANYGCILSLPIDIDDDFEKNVFDTFDKMCSKFQEKEFNTIAIDIKRLENTYSTKHSDVLKKFLRNMSNKEDKVVFLCK